MNSEQKSIYHTIELVLTFFNPLLTSKKRERFPDQVSPFFQMLDFYGMYVKR